MKFNRVELVTAVIVVAAGSSFCQATDSPPELMNHASPAAIQAILKSIDVPFTDSTNGTATRFDLTLNGQKTTLMLGLADLRLSLSLAVHPQLEQVNQWNAGHRYAKAYVDSEGSARLEGDLDLSGGVSGKAVQIFISMFGATARQFSEEFSKPGTQVTTATGRASKTRVGLPVADFAFWINLNDWQPAENRGNSILFRQASGDGYAMILTDFGAPKNGLVGLKEAIMANLKNNVPDVKVTLDDKRSVSGHDVLYLGLEGTVNGIRMQYLSYAYSSPAATILILTYISKDAFEKNRPMFNEFLNGLEISEPIADPDIEDGRLTLPSKTASISFDKSKWKILPASQRGRYMLAHSSGDAFAQVIWEGMVIPLGKLVEAALANVKRVGSGLTVTFSKRTVVRGMDLYDLRFDATVQGNILSYHNYYFSGKAGSIQIMTWSKKDDSAKYEQDLIEFLNGFHVTE